MSYRVRLQVERVVLLAAIVVLWEFSSGRLAPATVIGSPSEIFGQLGQWFADGEVWRHIGVTLYEAVGGYVAGSVAGIIVGIFLGLNPFIARVLDPLITGIYSIPKVTFAPLLILYFGIGTPSKIGLAFLIVFFFVFYDTFHGVRSVDDDILNAVVLMGAGRLQLFRTVTWPSTREWIIDGLKISVPMSFIGAVAGEIIVSAEGLGFLVRDAARRLDVSGIFAALLILALLSTAVALGVNHLRARAGIWRGENATI